MNQDMRAQAPPQANPLQARAGGIDPGVLARAEAALKSLAGQFSQWLNDEIAKLESARAEVDAKGIAAAAGEKLYFRAHDLKGLGSTYEYPIITRISASLCKLLDGEEKRLKAPLYLVDAHINAIKAAVRDNIRDDSNPIGNALAEALETQVRDHFA